MNRKYLLFFALMLLIIAGTLTLYFVDKRVPMDPNAHGNTPGNMQNGGLFFEMDDKVYFSNASDDNCLYSMNVDESKPKRLTSMGTKYISGANGYLYFYMDSTSKSSKVTGLGSATNQYGIYRCKISGRDQVCLIRDFCGEVQLCGEYLYYQIKTTGTLNKMKCNKKDNSKVADELISPLCYDHGIIYYTGVNNDHDIHAMYTTSGDMSTSVISGSYFFPVVQDGYLYYLNGADGFLAGRTRGYTLWRTNLSTGEQERISDDRMDSFTMDRQHIYYSYLSNDSDSSDSLRRMDLDGDNRLVLFEGVVNSLNLTSRYLYFKTFGNDNTYYHIPLDLSAPATTFIITAK